MKRPFAKFAATAWTALALCVGFAPLPAAENAAIVERVGGDIRYLASDELEGRGPATKGLEQAAEHMIKRFQELGLTSGADDGSYRQPFEIAIDTKVIEPKTSLVLRGPDGQELKLELGKNFQPLAIGGGGKLQADVVFAGYGISAPKFKYDDYEGTDVEGKVVVIIRREPQQDDEQSPFDGKKVTSHSYIRTKLQAAKKRKAAAVLLINDPFTTVPKKADELVTPSTFGTRGMGIPFAHLTQAVVGELLAKTPIQAGETKLTDAAGLERHIDETLKPISQLLEGWTAEVGFEFESVKANVANVVGVIEGEGPLANETIVIGAHYDHLGYGPFGSRKPQRREIHNGADDNATGTAAVMELARRFSQRDKKPARRLVFIGFSAEERGIIGSNYYIEHPLIPLEETVAMINFDMIGHLQDKGLLLGGVRSAQGFAGLVEQANGKDTIKVNTSGPMGGSDHSGFYRKGIPVFAFFTGMTDLYHTPDDDFDTINVEGVVETINFAERLLDRVLAMPERPKFVKSKAKPQRGGAMAYLGIVPDYAGTGDGLRVTDVNKDSPAAAAGMKTGDFIIKIGEIDVPDIQGLANGLRKYKAGQKVDFVVRRGKEEKTLKVTLGQPKKGA